MGEWGAAHRGGGRLRLGRVGGEGIAAVLLDELLWVDGVEGRW